MGVFKEEGKVGMVYLERKGKWVCLKRQCLNIFTIFSYLNQTDLASCLLVLQIDSFITKNIRILILKNLCSLLCSSESKIS